MDLIINMNDPHFAEKLAGFLGFEKGDVINIRTPTFERTDGKQIKYFPCTIKEYEALPKMDKKTLLDIGCQMWEKVGNKIHWLYPAEWFEYIPEGFEVYSVNEKYVKFNKHSCDADTRFGALSYGFLQAIPE